MTRGSLRSPSGTESSIAFCFGSGWFLFFSRPTLAKNVLGRKNLYMVRQPAWSGSVRPKRPPQIWFPSAPILKFFFAGFEPPHTSGSRPADQAHRGAIFGVRTLAGQKFKLNFANFLGEHEVNSEKRGLYESPPHRYVPSSSLGN